MLEGQQWMQTRSSDDDEGSLLARRKTNKPAKPRKDSPLFPHVIG